ncbi:MAG: hypothetical protein ACKOBY_00970, partial [Cyanobium sp.]
SAAVPVSSATIPCSSGPSAGSGSDATAAAIDAASSRPPGQSFSIDALQGWHLPLLDDPAFLPLQPLLQRALLLAVPDRLITALASRPPLAPHVLVATGRDRRGRQQALGLIVSRRLNRSGSCWQVEHLRLSLQLSTDPSTPSRRTIAGALLREAILRGRGAASWIAVAAGVDDERLAWLREQGFQPQRTDRVWRWTPGGRHSEPSASPSATALPDNLQLRPLHSRTAALLWHLEQACCPAPLRQLLDRRVEDLLDQSRNRGWMLIDPARSEAVAAVRCLEEHPSGGQQVEFSLHPGWSHLLGPATEQLLRQLAQRHNPLWLVSEVGDSQRGAWLESIEAESCGEQVLMARSVWRRQEWQPAHAAGRRLAAVLEQLQPRRQPLPSPLRNP